MNPVLRNIIIFVIAVVIGNIVNMVFVLLGMQLFPVEGLQELSPENLHSAYNKGLLTTKHYIFPLLAHAMGTLVAAGIVGYFSKSRQRVWYVSVGILFLVMGWMNLNVIPHPKWFRTLDIAICYLPMAFLGGRLGVNLAKQRASH